MLGEGMKLEYGKRYVHRGLPNPTSPLVPNYKDGNRVYGFKDPDTGLSFDDNGCHHIHGFPHPFDLVREYHESPHARLSPQDAATEHADKFFAKYFPELEPAKKPKGTKVIKPSLFNEATRELLDTAKAKRLADEADAQLKKLKKKLKKAEQKQLLRDQSHRRKVEYARSCREAFAAPVPEPAKPVKRREPLPPELTLHCGEKIPGSVLRRDFCCWCGRAIRVVDHSIKNICLDCKPTGCPGEIRSTIVSSGIAYHGGRFHAGEW